VWTVANTTPYVVEATVLRNPSGTEIFVVVLKGTFFVQPDGTCEVDEEQLPITRIPEYSAIPGRSSLVCDSDFVPVKLTTDVLLVGHAYAQRGGGSTSVIVHMRVDAVEKRLRVWGDRHWNQGVTGWTASDAMPFARMPIEYERTLGGSIGAPTPDGVWRCDPRNPIGRGFGGTAHRYNGEALANIEYEDSRSAPAGFGPICRHWSPRVELAGTHDDIWRQDQFPLPPIDFDDAFYNTAPADQLPTRHLSGGEKVSLKNLTPEGAMEFVLPEVHLVFNTQIGAAVEPHEAKMHTLLFRPDERRVVMTWVSTLPCQGRTSKIRRIHVCERQPVKRRSIGSAGVVN
jgi:hypothetical protein